MQSKPVPEWRELHCKLNLWMCQRDLLVDTYVNDYQEWLTVILCSQDQVNGFHCTCPSGYFGDRCQSDTDDCISQPCMNGSTCHVSTSILSTSIIRSYKILCSTIILVWSEDHIICFHRMKLMVSIVSVHQAIMVLSVNLTSMIVHQIPACTDSAW